MILPTAVPGFKAKPGTTTGAPPAVPVPVPVFPAVMALLAVLAPLPVVPAVLAPPSVVPAVDAPPVAAPPPVPVLPLVPVVPPPVLAGGLSPPVVALESLPACVVGILLMDSVFCGHFEFLNRPVGDSLWLIQFPSWKDLLIFPW